MTATQVQADIEELDDIVASYFAQAAAWKAERLPPKRMRRTFQIESSMYAPFARWVPGGSYYEEDCTVEYPAHLDHLGTDDLEEMAMNDVYEVRFVTRAEDYRAGWDIFKAGGMTDDCLSVHMQAGWKASQDADAAMRKVGVRA